MKVYVYHDSDHGDIEVFSSLKGAMDYGVECSNNHVFSANHCDDNDWEKLGTRTLKLGEYQFIYTRELTP